MRTTDLAQVLVVSDRPGDTPVLVDAITDRALRGPAAFHVLVPYPAHAEVHPLDARRRDHREEARHDLHEMLPALQAAVPDHSVTGSVSVSKDVMDAVESALTAERFDEIILITVPHEIERRLHVDLPHRLAHLGVPITTIVQPLGAAHPV